MVELCFIRLLFRWLENNRLRFEIGSKLQKIKIIQSELEYKIVITNQKEAYDTFVKNFPVPSEINKALTILAEYIVNNHLRNLKYNILSLVIQYLETLAF